MTKEQAAKTVARWWVTQMKSGSWDNGDAKCNAFAAICKGMADKPSADSHAPVEAAIEKYMLENIEERQYSHKNELYSDYGCHRIDELAASVGVKYNTMLHGPVKSGTTVEFTDGVFSVRAKSGYGGEWVQLSPVADEVVVA